MRKRPHFLNKIPIFPSNWGSEIGQKYANFSDFWALLPEPEITSLERILANRIFHLPARLQQGRALVLLEKEKLREVGSGSGRCAQKSEKLAYFEPISEPQFEEKIGIFFKKCGIFLIRRVQFL